MGDKNGRQPSPDWQRLSLRSRLPAVQHVASSLTALPQEPAVYALYSGRDIIYVGITGSLRTRIKQHLVNRDSSIATGTSAAMLNPDHVTPVVGVH